MEELVYFCCVYEAKQVYKYLCDGFFMENNDNCPCVYVSCERHGNCDACQEYHRGCGDCTSCGK
jgi:hypothetical protein